MIQKLSIWLYKISTFKRTLLSLLILILFSVLVLPGQASQMQAYGSDLGSPDLSFTYTVDKLYQMAETYGDDGRESYVRARFTFDLIWPIVYGAALVTAISSLLRRSLPTYSWMRQLNLIPILGMLFDYLENISTSLVMARYPERTAVVDSLATFFTPTKWILIALSFGLLLFGIVLTGKEWIERRR